jgi:RsiW-degrading membrane proteinase PrsW (M82 family)
MLGILSAGIAPGIALLSYFYLRDEFGIEPISMVFKTFMFGALLVFPISFIQYVIQVEGIVQSEILNAFIVIGFLEEFFKWFIMIYVVYQHTEFDEPYDGVVYGAAVSLGFATVENILYLFANGLEYAISRALLPVSSHALFGVIMGYYFGKSKFKEQEKKKWLIRSLMLPVFLHGLYDYILLSRQDWLYLIFPFMIFLWWMGLKKVKQARALTAQLYQKNFTIN